MIFHLNIQKFQTLRNHFIQMVEKILTLVSKEPYEPKGKLDLDHWGALA